MKHAYQIVTPPAVIREYKCAPDAPIVKVNVSADGSSWEQEIVARYLRETTRIIRAAREETAAQYPRMF